MFQLNNLSIYCFIQNLYAIFTTISLLCIQETIFLKNLLNIKTGISHVIEEGNVNNYRNTFKTTFNNNHVKPNNSFQTKLQRNRFSPNNILINNIPNK